jgi:hypothetical protein
MGGVALMEFRTTHIKERSGSPLSGADVYCYEPGTSTERQIFDAAGVALTQPQATGVDGNVSFAARNGKADIVAVLNGATQRNEDVYFYDPSDENWNTRAELVTVVADGYTWPDGAVISDGTVSYKASSGATDISDLPGLLPFMAGDADAHLYHFVASSVTGAATITAAGQAMIDYVEGFATGGAIVFPAGILDIATAGTIAVPPAGTLNYVWKISKPLTVVGSGMGVTQFNVQDADTIAFYVGGDDPFNGDIIVGAKFKDLTINNDSGSAGATGGYGILLDRSQAVIDTVRTNNFWRGVGLFGCPEGARLTFCDLNTTLSQSVVSGSAMLYIGRREVASSVGGAHLDSDGGATDGDYFVEPNTVLVDNCNMRPGALAGYVGAEYTVLIGCGDGVHISQSHIAWGEKAAVAYIPEQSDIGFTTQHLNEVHLDPLFSDGARPDSRGIYAADLNGFGTTSMSDLRVTGVDISGAAGDAIYIDLDIMGVMISNTSTKLTGGRAAYIANCADVSINGFGARSSDQDGNSLPVIELETCARVNIDNLMMNDFFDGIYVHSDCSRVNIGENITAVNKDASGTTIYAESGADLFVGRHLHIGEGRTIASANQIRIPLGFDDVYITGTTDIWEILMDAPTSGFEARIVNMTFQGVLNIKDDGSGSVPGGVTPNIRIGADQATSNGYSCALKWEPILSRWIMISERTSAP